MSVRITSNHFPEFIDWNEAKVEAGVRMATFEVEREAVGRAPVGKTGHLRNSIGSHSSGGQGTVYASAEYAIFQEEGTRYFSGRHFLGDSLAAVAPNILRYVKAAG